MRYVTTTAAIFLIALVFALPALAVSAKPDKVFVCHAAGRADEPANWVTLEVPATETGYPQGHFTENGTQEAGHEQDTLGPCPTPSSSPSVPPTGTPGPTITPEPSPSVEPSSTPTFTSPPSPSASPTITPEPSTPTTSPSPTAVPTQSFTPLPTPPATDTEPASTTGSGFPWVLAVLAGVVGGTVFAIRKNPR